MHLAELIMLQRKAVSTDGMGGQNGEFVDVQAARAMITPIRAKSGLIEGGKKSVGIYKVVVWHNAFGGNAGGVLQGDRFVWQTNGDKKLYFNLEHNKPVGDAYAEFEATLTDG